MVRDFIICLLAFFNIFIFFYLKKEGSRKGSKRGVHVLSTPNQNSRIATTNDSVLNYKEV